MDNQLQKIDFNADQIELIKSQIAKGATNQELELFLYQCRRTGLDPLTRQIYFMKRKVGNDYKMTVQTSIDGFRVIAERSNDYGGQDEPEFIYKGEKNDILDCAKVKVYRFRGDQRYLAAVGVAYWKEYFPGDAQGFMWKKMPHTMLSKVAEALALRKAYPQDLSGLYTLDEMQQSGQTSPTEETVEAEFNEVPTKEEKQLLMSLVYTSDMDESEKEAAMEKISVCTDYKMFERIQHRLESRQKSIHDIQNPSQKDINNHLKAVVQ